MNKELISTAASLIKAAGTVKSVRLWNSELWENTDTLDRFPLVFLEFSNLNYGTLPSHKQECNAAQMTVHLLYKTIDPEDLGVVDVSQEVFVALQRGGYKRLSEVMEYSNQEIIDWQIVFECPRFIDEDAKDATTSVKKIDTALEITLQ